MVEGEKKIVGITSLKEGSYVVIDNEPCKVTSFTVSKAGKHGHAKVRLTAVGLFDDKKRELMKPGGDSVEVPILDKRNGQILSITGNTANVMDSDTFETLDMEIPNELKSELKEGIQVIYWVILDRKIIKQIKTE